MNPPKSQSQEYPEIIRKRRRLITLSSIPFFVLAAVAFPARVTAGRFLGIPFSIASPVFYAVFLATLVFHVAVWRCPACGAYLGLVASSRFCPKCGVGFDAESNTGRIKGFPGRIAR